jgi:predicted DNA-binding transcriptional regulator AlpA
MGLKVDLDELVDAGGVAEILGLSKRNSVRTYRNRYVRFPAPQRVFCGSRCPVWLRSDIEAWNRDRGPRRQ